jgi:hypothetical protein
LGAPCFLAPFSTQHQKRASALVAATPFSSRSLLEAHVHKIAASTTHDAQKIRSDLPIKESVFEAIS